MQDSQRWHVSTFVVSEKQGNVVHQVDGHMILALGHIDWCLLWQHILCKRFQIRELVQNALSDISLSRGLELSRGANVLLLRELSEHDFLMVGSACCLYWCIGGVLFGELVGCSWWCEKSEREGSNFVCAQSKT